MYTAALLLSISSILSAQTRAIDYAGGWLDDSVSSGECVDICSAPSATCLTKDPTCLAKEKVPGDFDYLVLEQLFVPQFCRDLLVGVDGTISHQNVNPYPNGTACVPDQAVSKLTIHGLWPNYDDGYVSCCNPSDSVANDPYDAAKFSENQASLLAEMGEKWIDATQESTYNTLCEIYDHEFQKHGLCYAAQGADLEAAAVTYFEATLNTADRISAATEQINAWAALDTPQTTLAEIQALYDHQVMVFCSAVDGENQLSVIRTCYEKPTDIGSEGPTTQIDCANATATSTFSVCSGDEPITLLPYVAPGSTSSSASTGSATSEPTLAPTTTPTSEPTIDPNVNACV
ncbi:Ribonuclease [Phytophthora palmivora]|uniref:Ribonuclease n=2 Tax=Phytophthora palmivora TaxID=4796 RepID=A0A2P4X220_9STRA|nr:Ribonuclease [Phytophthora palmivora]